MKMKIVPTTDSIMLEKIGGRISGMYKIVAKGTKQSRGFKVGDKIVVERVAFINITNPEDPYKSQNLYFCKSTDILARLEAEEE